MGETRVVDWTNRLSEASVKLASVKLAAASVARGQVHVCCQFRSTLSAVTNNSSGSVVLAVTRISDPYPTVTACPGVNG